MTMGTAQLNKKTTPKESALISALKEQIHSKLNAMGINGRELERRAALTQGTIRNILNGTSSNPTSETLNAIATAFNCSLDELFNKRANSSPSNAIHSSNTITPSILKTIPWQPDLQEAIISSLKLLLKRNHADINSEKAFCLIQEIYIYLIQKNKTTVDDSLVEWLFDKTP